MKSDYTIETKSVIGNRSAVLKQYYARYLTEVRGLSASSVRHYYDALNNISRRLKDKGLVKQDIYEIMDLDRLAAVRDILFADSEFIELNERGRRMYSAGLNNYYRFASGEEFVRNEVFAAKLDMPIAPEEPIIIEQTVWRRSNILRQHAFAFADFKCEIDNDHKSFVAESTRKPYMEGHHAIPMKLQSQFDKSLDVYANIVCLCPLCHRRIHYGMKDDRTRMMNHIYADRAERLAMSGIRLSKEEFLGIAVNRD